MCKQDEGIALSLCTNALVPGFFLYETSCGEYIAHLVEDRNAAIPDDLKVLESFENKTYADGQAGAVRRQGQQLQDGLGHDAQQAFRADKQTVQIEPGLVLMGPAPQPHEGPVCEGHFQPEHRRRVRRSRLARAGRQPARVPLDERGTRHAPESDLPARE